MENKFVQIMQNHSDEELFEIVTRFKNDYQPEAVLAAEEELNKRNIPNERFEKVREFVKVKELKEEFISKEHLGIPQKILFLICSISLIPILVAAYYERQGYLKKYQDAWKFMKIGLYIWGAIILLQVLSLIFS
jgi:hypothetical protein